MATVLITGGSSGIGLALSKVFLEKGYDLVIVSKPQEELSQAYNTLHAAFPTSKIYTLQKDLSQASAADELYQIIQKKEWTIDVLINNAGFGTFGYFQETNEQDELAMIDLNVRTVYRLTKLFLKEMTLKDQGHIINIASLSAFFPSPYLAAYAATKAFVLHLGEGINYELKDKGSKVRVTTVCPTPVRTGFRKRAKMETSKLFDHWTRVSAERVAKDTYKAMLQKRTYLIPDWRFHWVNKIASRLPLRIKLAMAKDSLL